MTKKEILKELERVKKANQKEYYTRGNTQRCQELFARIEELEKMLESKK